MLIWIIVTFVSFAPHSLSSLALPQKVAIASPEDYAQSFVSSRVKSLVDFFETLDKNSYGPSASQNISVILSLDESALKLYTLSHGQPLNLKCDRYVKLLSQPNIRTVATVSGLMKESQAFSEIEQKDANLMANLMSERKFDALARIQTILQSLEMEQSLGKSNFEPNVEKDLLDCVNYYVYRHQRATNTIVRHVRETMEKLPESLIASGKHEVIFRQLSQAIHNVEAIESEQKNFRHQDWLLELSRIHELTLESGYEIPENVRKFLTDSRRIERLNWFHRGEELKRYLLEYEERVRLQENEHKRYLDSVRNLHDICKHHGQMIPTETCLLTQDITRLKLVGLGEGEPGDKKQHIGELREPSKLDNSESSLVAKLSRRFKSSFR